MILDEAYVSIGDSTVIMAGKKSSIANFGDSTAFNFLGTFGYTTTPTPAFCSRTTKTKTSPAARSSRSFPILAMA